MRVSLLPAIASGRLQARTDLDLSRNGGHKTQRKRPENAAETETCRRREVRRQAIRARTDPGRDDFLFDGTPAPQAARVLAAARVFAEGSHYFSGTLVDRSA